MMVIALDFASSGPGSRHNWVTALCSQCHSPGYSAWVEGGESSF